MSSVSEQGNKLKQTMELARAALLKDKSWSSEFSAQDLESLASSAMATIDAVTKPGLVTVRITGGEKGVQNVKGAIDVAGLEGKMGIGFKINRAHMELANVPGKPQGQERLQVLDNVTTDPKRIMMQDVAGLLKKMIGGEKINEQFVTAFKAELGSGAKPVQLATYGLALTERNTFKVSLTAK